MSVLELNINSKLYQIGCSVEDIPKIKEYAKELNKRIADFKTQNPKFFMGLNDERVFLFQALTLIADLQDLKNSLQNITPLENELSKNELPDSTNILINNLLEKIQLIENNIKQSK